MKDVYEQGEFTDYEIIHFMSGLIFAGTVAIRFFFFKKKKNS